MWISSFCNEELAEKTRPAPQLALIRGSQARLRREDRPGAEPKLVARSLLPAEAAEGVRLKFELFEYQIVK